MRHTDILPVPGHLRRLGIHGFDEIEPVILAALLTEDPLLLIGNAGTGKTLLLNTLAAALGLAHRHYNAALTSFDDIVGYPYPSPDGRSVDFLQTPATLWGAASVLVDELSRAKPEVQNKFFTLIHERVLQGIPLPDLVYRWAAMNPCGQTRGRHTEIYDGSQPLDAALADRFGFIVLVPDWRDLPQADQDAVIRNPAQSPEAEACRDLRDLVLRLRPAFRKAVAHLPGEVVAYALNAVSYLTDAGIRLSPRRARLLARNITALQTLGDHHRWPLDPGTRSALYRLALQWSIPHRAFRPDFGEQKLDAAHAEASRIAFEENPRARWVSELLITEDPVRRTAMLLDPDIDRDTRSLAVARLMGRETPDRWAMLAFCLYPHFDETGLVTDESLDLLARTAAQVLDVDGEMAWQEAYSAQGEGHPDWNRCQHLLDQLPDDPPLRKARARNLFLHLLAVARCPFDPAALEAEMTACLEVVRRSITRNRNRA